MYKYYVSYAHDRGFGYCEIIRDKEINDCNDVVNMSKVISKSGGVKDVVIINYILLPCKADKSVNKDE